MTEQEATKTKVAIVGDGRNQEKTLIAHTMELLNELEQYRALGTVEELTEAKELYDSINKAEDDLCLLGMASKTEAREHIKAMAR